MGMAGQSESKELGAISDLGRISIKNPRSWGGFWNRGGLADGVQGVGNHFGIGKDFDKESMELGRILE